MNKFSKLNSEIEQTMKTHLIGNIEAFGIWEDNYDKFLKERSKALSREIKKRIIPQETDKTLSAEQGDETSENEKLLNE